MTDVEVLALLEGLGETADEVANSLRAAKVRGHRGTCGSCPIARHLHQQGVDSPSVLTLHVWVNRNSRSMRITLPQPVCDFVRRFDAGDFEDLALRERWLT